MAATLLNSPQAVAMSLYVFGLSFRCASNWRQIGKFSSGLVEIDKTLLEHDSVLREIYRKLLPLLQPPQIRQNGASVLGRPTKHDCLLIADRTAPTAHCLLFTIYHLLFGRPRHRLAPLPRACFLTHRVSLDSERVARLVYSRLPAPDSRLSFEKDAKLMTRFVHDRANVDVSRNAMFTARAWARLLSAIEV